MKNLFIALLLISTVTVFARVYKNTGDKHGNVRYSFRLVRKYGDRIGIFTPVYDRTTYVQRAVGNALSARGGGGGKIITEPVYKKGDEDHDIIIVGMDLKKIVDGDVVPLNNRVLYQIGQHTTPDGFTLAVFSFNKNAKVGQYLPYKPPTAGVASSICCPHCGKEIKLNPSR